MNSVVAGGTLLSGPSGSRGIDEILAESRSRLDRLEPLAAHRAHGEGAVLVDIRPAAQRAQAGEIPGALIIERNVLEWRFDPRSDARLAVAGSYELPVIIFCQEGYTSSLAAVALKDLGLHRSTDLAGGFAAWQAAGLPTTPSVSPADPEGRRSSRERFAERRATNPPSRPDTFGWNSVATSDGGELP